MYFLNIWIDHKSGINLCRVEGSVFNDIPVIKKLYLFIYDL